MVEVEYPRTRVVLSHDEVREQMLEKFNRIIHEEDPDLFNKATFEVLASRPRRMPKDGQIFVVLKRKTRNGVTKDKLDVVMNYNTWSTLSDNDKFVLAKAVTIANNVPWVPNAPDAVVDIRSADEKISKCYAELTQHGIEKPLTMYSYGVHRRRFGELTMYLTRVAFFYRTPNMRGGVRQCGATIYKRVIRGEVTGQNVTYASTSIGI